MKAGRGFLALLAVLAAGALGAPLAHAGSYDVLSCTIDGGYHANNAWVAGNNPAGNAAYSTDTTCPKSGDPLGVSLAPNTAYSAGTFAALWLYAPAQTTITDYKLTLRQYWFAPPLANYPTERTYTLASFGDDRARALSELAEELQYVEAVAAARAVAPRAAAHDARQPGEPDAARGRGAGAARAGAAQPADRRSALRLGQDGRPPRGRDPAQARRPHAWRGGRGGPAARPRP